MTTEEKTQLSERLVNQLTIKDTQIINIMNRKEYNLLENFTVPSKLLHLIDLFNSVHQIPTRWDPSSGEEPTGLLIAQLPKNIKLKKKRAKADKILFLTYLLWCRIFV